MSLLVRQGANQPWHPDNIGRDLLVAWWTASDHGGPNMTDDGGGLISSWKDRINGINVTAVTTARPTYNATGLHGGPALQFDGVANCLAATTGLGALPIGTTSGEIYVRCSQDEVGSNAGTREAVHYGPGASTANASRFLTRIPVSNVNRARVSDVTVNLTDAAVDFSGFHVIGGRWDAATEYGYIDNAAFSTPSAVDSFNTTIARLRIGANHNAAAANFWLGWISDIIVISGVLPAAQRTKLLARWTA